MKNEICFTAVSRIKQLDFGLQNWWTFEERAVLGGRVFKVWKFLRNKVVLLVKRIQYFLHFSLFSLFSFVSSRPWNIRLFSKILEIFFQNNTLRKETATNFQQKASLSPSQNLDFSSFLQLFQRPTLIKNFTPFHFQTPDWKNIL